MITLRRSAERGHAEHGWLDSYHTFSFADYHDPEHMGFSVLRVLNQDRVAAGQGFGAHGHRDMEIVSYVLDGALEHRDSMGNGSRMRPGEVQLMSAGTGVTHSEFNPSSDAELHFLQMWILPALRGTRPRYEQRAFPEAERRGRLRLVVAPDGAGGALSIGQDARLWAGLLDGAEQAAFRPAPGRSAWLHVARGNLALNGLRLGPGDAIATVGERELLLEGASGAELVLWDLPEPGAWGADQVKGRAGSGARNGLLDAGSQAPSQRTLGQGVTPAMSMTGDCQEKCGLGELRVSGGTNRVGLRRPIHACDALLPDSQGTPMSLLTPGLSLVLALGSGYSLTNDPSGSGNDEKAPTGALHSCDGPDLNLLEVPAGEFDPTSIPQEDGIVWYGTWEGAMAERDRTGKPVMLHIGSPRRPTEFVCVPGAW